jgi:hypothetical protein
MPGFAGCTKRPKESPVWVSRRVLYSLLYRLARNWTRFGSLWINGDVGYGFGLFL